MALPAHQVSWDALCCELERWSDDAFHHVAAPYIQPALGRWDTSRRRLPRRWLRRLLEGQREPRARIASAITIQPEDLKGRGLKHLAESHDLAEVTRLEIGDWPTSQDHLRALLEHHALSNLTHLHVAARSFNTANIHKLANHHITSKIKSLAIRWANQRTDAALAPFLNAPAWSSLEHLNLSGNNLRGARGQALASSTILSRLKSLDLSYASVDVDTIRALASSPHLKRLRDLDLHRSSFHHDGVDILADAPWAHTLEALDLSYSLGARDKIATLTDPARWPALRSLAIGGCSSAGANPRILATSSLPSLEHLTLDRCGIKPDGFEALAESEIFENLRTLSIAAGSFDMHEAPNFLTRHGSTSLEALCLAECRIGPKQAAWLAGSDWIRSLQVLDLRSNRLGDDGCAAIASSPNVRNLRELVLASNQLSPRCVVSLASSENLENLLTLDLRNNRLDAEAVEAFASRGSLPSLRFIELKNTGNARRITGAIQAGAPGWAPCVSEQPHRYSTR